MLNKLYDKIKNIVKENYKSALVLLCCFVLFTFPLPYYIQAPGGILDVSTRVVVEDSKNINGSFNLAYVTELKATIPFLIYSWFNDDWDILKKEEVLENETVEQIEYRNHLLLNEANSNAILVSFNKANEYVEVINRKIFVIYKLFEADTDLVVGDEIIEVNGIKVESKKQLLNIIEQSNDNIIFKVINDGVEYTRYGNKKNIDDSFIIGIIVAEEKELDTNRDVLFKFKKSESGPSGGFMMALSIYNYLTEEDITNGLKIVGTGTIDEDGNVGSIGGVEYKIKAAYKEKADLFFVPLDNYEEAKKVVIEDNLDIKLISISTIDEAINYLNNLD